MAEGSEVSEHSVQRLALGCSGRRPGTWLVVNGGDVDLKRPDVGHQESQKPPVEHLREDKWSPW